VIEFIIDGMRFFLVAFTILTVISGLAALGRYVLRWLLGEEK